MYLVIYSQTSLSQILETVYCIYELIKSENVSLEPWLTVLNLYLRYSLNFLYIYSALHLLYTVNIFLLCGVGASSELHNPVGIHHHHHHHPPSHPTPAAAATSPRTNQTALMPIMQEQLVNGSSLEQLASINNIPAVPSVSQMSEQQHQQQPSVPKPNTSNCTQPNTPIHSLPGTPYTSPVPTPIHMQVDQPSQQAPSQQPSQLLAMVCSTNGQDSNMDLPPIQSKHSTSVNNGQRSPLLNGQHDGTPYTTPVPSPNPVSAVPTPSNILPEQFRLQLIPESQFKQEVL